MNYAIAAASLAVALIATASPPAAGQTANAAADSGALEEIVVTARKREESILSGADFHHRDRRG